MSNINFERKSLQLNQFIEKYFYSDEPEVLLTYNHDSDVFFVELNIKSESCVYNLVTQKNNLRSFSSMKSLFNTLPFTSGLYVDLTFESSEK